MKAKLTKEAGKPYNIMNIYVPEEYGHDKSADFRHRT